MSKGKKKSIEDEDVDEVDENGRARLNLLIDRDLKQWAQRYAKGRCTTITALVTRHLVHLRANEHEINVEQI